MVSSSAEWHVNDNNLMNVIITPAGSGQMSISPFLFCVHLQTLCKFSISHRSLFFRSLCFKHITIDLFHENFQWHCFCTDWLSLKLAVEREKGRKQQMKYGNNSFWNCNLNVWSRIRAFEMFDLFDMKRIFTSIYLRNKKTNTHTHMLRKLNWIK